MKLWCLLSGGKDSMTTADVLDRRKELAGCVFLDTGIAVPDLLPFIRETCIERGWELEVYKAPRSYESYVRAYGFPGPPQHSTVMSVLKGRGIRAFGKAHPDATLASGVRRGESGRRFRNVTGKGILEGVPILAPLYRWSTRRVWDYVRDHKLRLSPAYENLHISGDCLCGAYARPEEVYPAILGEIARLEELVAKDATVSNRKTRTWGWGARGSSARGALDQTRLERFLCHGCSEG